MFYTIFFVLLLVTAAWCAWRISVADWRRRIIPDAYLFPMMLIGLTIINFFPWPIDIADAIIAAIFGYVLTTLIGLIFSMRNKHHNKSDIPIGMGDIKLISVGGLWLGTTGLAIALALACIAGLLWGGTRKQKYIPFAPFFIGGGILSLIIIWFLI